jgi:hypothetical protein
VLGRVKGMEKLEKLKTDTYFMVLEVQKG